MRSARRQAFAELGGMRGMDLYEGVVGGGCRPAECGVMGLARAERIGTTRRADLTRDSFESCLRLMKMFRVSEAKRNFGKLFARAKKGEVVVLQNGSDFMQLVPFVLPEPVPLRPVGYFRPSEDEIARINAAPSDSGPLR